MLYNYDHDAIPQWELAFERQSSVSETDAEKIHYKLLEHHLLALGSGNVSAGRCRSTWLWVFDAFVREEPLAGTFRAFCAQRGCHPMELIKDMAWRGRKQLDALFGEGMAQKVIGHAELALPDQVDTYLLTHALESHAEVLS